MKTIHLIYVIINLILFSHVLNAMELISDSTATLNGYAYEETEIQPLEGVTIYIQRLNSEYEVVDEDSVITDAEGRFSIEIDTGLYNLYAWLSGYWTTLDYSLIAFANLEYDLDFILIRPAFQSDVDRIDVTGPYDEPIEHKIIITNEGSGKLTFSSVLYLYEELPPDAYPSKAEPGLHKIDRQEFPSKVPQENQWKLLFRDERDQNPGEHDLSEIWMETDNENFYIKAVLYDQITSFDQFFFTYAMNIDRDQETGEPGGGYDYILAAANFEGNIGAVMVQYVNGNWYYMMDATYIQMNTSDDFIVIGFPLYILEYYDIMLANASVHPGMEDFSYYDQVPNTEYGDQFLFSLESDPAIHIDKLYGEAFSAGSDTITLTLLPEIINNPLDTFYIALLTNDIASPVVTFQVTIQPPVEALSDPDLMEDRLKITCYPNPFEESATFQYRLPEEGHVMLTIWNSNGLIVKNITDEFQAEGIHQVVWDGTNNSGNPVKSGFYLYSLHCKDIVLCGKLFFMQ